MTTSTDSRSDYRANSYYWLTAMLSPLAVALLAYVISLQSNAGPCGTSAVLGFLFLTGLGCIASIVSAFVSRAKRERKFTFGLLGALPSVAWLLYVIVLFFF